jgi:hypothetical protein
MSDSEIGSFGWPRSLRQARALVAIHEGLVLGDVEGARGAHLKEPDVHKVPAEGLGGHAHRGLERGPIVDAWLLAVGLEHLQ